MRKDGPFFQSLEHALVKLHVQRQAYHGGTFVGNHVHKLVQVFIHCALCFCTFYYSHTQESNAKILCSGLVDVADSCSCAEMKEPAKRVAAQFTKALTLFGKCHNLYNGSTLSQKDIQCFQLSRSTFSYLHVLHHFCKFKLYFALTICFHTFSQSGTENYVAPIEPIQSRHFISTAPSSSITNAIATCKAIKIQA